VGLQPAQFNYHDAAGEFLHWFEAQKTRIVEHTGNLWDTERAELEELRILGLTMLKHYALWCPPFDENIIILALEKRFRLPVPGAPKIVYEGRFDGFVQLVKSGGRLVLEFKTARSLKPNVLSGVFRDLQATAYHWAAQELFEVPVEGVLFRILRKRAPDNPRMTSRGTFSRDKRQSSTVNWIRYYLNTLANTPEDGDPVDMPNELIRERYRDLADRAAELLSMVREKQDPYFQQSIIHRSPHQVANLVKVLRTIGTEMVDPKVLIFAEGGYHCSMCRFRDPCDLLSIEQFQAAEDMLAAEYAPRDYWEPEEKVV
jgi:hypothetical protein